jgi:beta-glucanase (GH16 family)
LALLWEGHEYTSARLVTKGKGDWTYGRIEVKAKLPSGRGTWGGADSVDEKIWPQRMEIDYVRIYQF